MPESKQKDNFIVGMGKLTNVLSTTLCQSITEEKLEKLHLIRLRFFLSCTLAFSVEGSVYFIEIVCQREKITSLLKYR